MGDPNSPYHYPINITDKNNLGIGPMLGRYPGDVYDGDVPSAGDVRARTGQSVEG
jgi:glucoamylase